MLSATLLLLLVCSCVEISAVQQLTNPDNEPPYQDVVDGSMKAKSRVLSGIGPPAAINRYFDWDESCIDGTQRTQIALAWGQFQRLVTSSSSRLNALRSRLPDQRQIATDGTINRVNKKFIMVEDPAYGQMFRGRDGGLQSVIGAYDSITNNIRNFPARGGNGPPALRFICNADDHVKKGNGESFCGSGSTAAQAIAVVPQGDTDSTIMQKYRFSTASSIVFCPVFFIDSKLPPIHRVWADKQIKPDLSKVDCKERVMLHEYLHLPWTQDLEPLVDHIGYLNVARYASGATWDEIRVMPDAYAWYALYSAYNNEHEGCGRDIWPARVKKPVNA